MQFKDYYTILGVSRQAAPAQGAPDVTAARTRWGWC
jgi:hypothetical protein